MADSTLQQAFVDLLNGHQGLVHRVARAYASTPADRQDLFQEIVYQLWRSFPNYRGTAAASTWVYRIALNTAITSLRQRGRRPAHLPIDAAGAEGVPPTQGHEGEIDVLYRAIRELNPVDRALIMCYLDDLSYKRIGEVLGISQTNVGARLTRVKAKLQRMVAERE